MARILQVDTFRAAEAGDSDIVQEDVVAMLGLGPQAGELPFLVCGLVGLALDGVAYRTTPRAAGEVSRSFERTAIGSDYKQDFKIVAARLRFA